jgi:DNA invertase Pin-like site-specific DNA recombinase
VKLPRSLDDLAGLRAARWTRESTSGQYDAFGPEAQQDQQDRAIERYGLVDTGLAWIVAHSGRTVGSTAQFGQMMNAAGRDYDVLVVGYVSRFARDLRTAVNARHDLHLAGAAILFADERVLTSDEDEWDKWAREAVEAESYSRKLARRIREGYAAKRRRLGEPGGRPPYGFVRRGRPPRLEPDDGLVRVREAFGLAARGEPDRTVCRAVGLSLHTARGILTNPVYIGKLRDGSPASVEPVIDRATWDRVQILRATRNARAGRPAVNRTYVLPMLRCAFCGRGLIGDSGRYRHLDPCAEFTALRPRQAFRNRLRRTPGHSYRQDRYESLVTPLLRQVGYELSSADLATLSEGYRNMAPAVDELALRRIEASRERVLAAYRSHRDPSRLEADMTRLDTEEQRLKESAEDRPSWRDVLAVLRDMPAMWEEAQPGERRRLAMEWFSSVDVQGGRGASFTFTAAGVQAVVMVGARGLDPTVTITRAPWLLSAVRSA